MKLLNSILSLLILCVLVACSSSEDSDPRGEVYFKANVTPSLSGLDWFGVGNETSNVLVKTGSSFTTSTFLHNKNDNLTYEVAFLDSENRCYTVTVETFFNNKSFDKRTFEMNASLNFGYIKCKDGFKQTVNLITPK